MAKTISDEKIKLSIIIDGNEAQKELFDLEKSTRKLTQENKALGLQKKLLIKQGKEETDEYKALTATMKLNTTEINSNKAKMKELQDQIGITALTMHQLTEKAKLLRMSLANTVPGSEAHKKYTAELGQVSARMDELKGKSQTAKMSLGSMADGFNRYQGLFISFIAGLTGIVLSIQKIIDINGKLSDAQSDVMKTTGMTKKEVDELTKSFGLLQTRTSRIDLLGIAEQGGRIGIAKAEIGDFVSVMNKASVSLGDSFTGGAEEVANKLGKIKFLFQQTKDMNVEESYNSIGSAINDLGANGTASEANIADFTTRIGSLTDVLKPTIQETLALGTAFEESGIESEVSARAYGIFMKQASTETAKFAKVMGTTQANVEAMINKNPLEFMIKFAEGMRGMSGTDTAKTLDALGISADGANKVIGAMGNNTARFRELIDLSNKSFADGTSMINEYGIKNSNLAATLQKLNNALIHLFSSEGFVNWLSGAVDWLSKFIGATEDADGSVTAWKNTLVFAAKIIAIVTAALITNTGWQKLVVLWTNRNTEANLLYTIGAKARAFADGVAMIASQAYAAATMLMTGNVKGAAQAFRVMTAAMMTTPWGFILSAIVAIGAAYVVFSKETDKMSKSQKLLNDLQYESANAIYKEKNELESLLKIANNEFESKENRLKAIKKLNEISPEYLGNLTLENLKTQEGKTLTDKYIESLQRLAYTKALNNKIEKIQNEKVDIETSSDDDVATFTDKFNAAGDKLTSFLPGSYGGRGKDSLKRRAKARRDQLVKEKEEEIAMVQQLIDQDIKNNPTNYLGDNDPTNSKFNIPGDKSGKSKKDPNKTQAEIDKESLDAQLKYNELFLKNARQLEDDKVAAMQDGYEKEMAIEGLRYKREIEDLEKQKVHNAEMAKLDADIANAKKDGDTKYYDALMARKKGWIEKNQNLDAQINAIKEGKLALHNIKLGVIEDNGAKKKLEKTKKDFDRQKILRETQFKDELNSITTLAQAKEKLKDTLSPAQLAQLKKLNQVKKALQDQFNDKELIRQKEYLNSLVEQLNSILNSKQFKGIDLEFLTPEMRDEFQKQIEELKKQIAELNGAIDSVANDDTEEKKEARKVRIAKIVSDAQAIASALMNTWAAYYDFIAAKENAQLKNFERQSDAKKKRLKSQLDNGYINQVQYKKGVEQIDQDLEKKKAEIEYKQAKRKKAIDIVNTVINTAVSIMQGYAQLGPVGGTIAAVLIGAMGALQIATIAKQPLPAKGYEEGKYPEYVKREQDGKTFKSRYGGKTRSGLVKDTSHFLVAENGPEMVIDNKAWREMDPVVKEALVRNLRGIKGFENGYYKDNTLFTGSGGAPDLPSSPAPSSSTPDNQMMQMMMSVIAENTAVMRDMKENGIPAYVTNKDLKSMKNLKDGIKSFDDLRNKAKT